MSYLPQSGARVSKDQHVLNLLMYRNGKLGLLYGSTMPKIHMISKKAFNKSCLEFNFLQKSTRTHMSISPEFCTVGYLAIQNTKVCVEICISEKCTFNKSAAVHSQGRQTYVLADFFVRDSIPNNFNSKRFFI